MTMPCALPAKVPLRGIGGHDTDRRVVAVAHPRLRQYRIVRQGEHILKMVFGKLRFQQFRQRTGGNGHFKNTQPPVCGPVAYQMAHNAIHGHIYTQAGRVHRTAFPGN